MYQVYALILPALAGIIYIEAPAVGGSAVTANCTIDQAYRTGTTLTAPAYVAIECTTTTHTDSDVRPFHDLRYHIDYNDDACASGSGAWTNSDSGALKNEEWSPVGGHVYECEGSFVMEATICDATGDCDTWTSDNFVVQSEDAGWPTTATTCVSTSGTFTDCPTGAYRVTSATGDYDTTLVTSAGSRTLYRCGETFTASTSPNLTDSSTNGSLIGSYGSQPCKSTVAINSGVDLHGYLISSAYGAGWRVRDIIYDAAGVLGSSAWAIFQGASTTPRNNVMFLRMETLDVAVCPSLGANPLQAPVHLRWSMVGLYCLHNVAGSGLWSGMELTSMQHAYVADSFWEIVGNTGGHRTYASDTNYFGHNRVRASGTSSGFVQSWRGHIGSTGVVTDGLVIQDNRYEDDSAEAGVRTILLSTVCGSSCNADPEDGRNVLVEGNRIAYGPNYGRATPSSPIIAMKRETTIRNNVIDWRPFAPSGTHGLTLSYTDGITANPTNIRVYNNTVIAAGSRTGTFAICAGPGSSSGNICRNNLMYDVDDTDATLSTGTFAFTSNNVHLNTTNCPFYGASGACEMTGVCVAGPDVDFDCFKLRASGGGVASIKDAGFTFPETDTGYAGHVYRDGFGLCRPFNTNWDIGAHEYGASGC